MHPNAARRVCAEFLLDVACSGYAWGLSCCGDICTVHGHGHMCLPLWSDGEVALQMQRRYWPNLVVTRISLDDVFERCLPTAREQGVLIGVGVAVDAEAVAIPAEAVEAGLRAALQMLQEKAAN